MSNSAFTPFVQTNFPAASATVSGMVTTSAQTFAGKKTLDGGAAIKGATDGVAIAAGYVGETVSVIGTTDLALTTSSFNTSATLAQYTFSYGIWMVIPCLHIKEVSGTTGEYRVGAALSTSSTATWSITQAITDGQVGISSTSGSISWDVSGIPLFINLYSGSSSLTYYLRATCFSNFGSGSANCRGAIKAIRIA